MPTTQLGVAAAPPDSAECALASDMVAYVNAKGPAPHVLLNVLLSLYMETVRAYPVHAQAASQVLAAFALHADGIALRHAATQPPAPTSSFHH